MKKYKIHNETYIVDIPIYFWTYNDKNIPSFFNAKKRPAAYVHPNKEGVWEMHFNLNNCDESLIKGIVAHECYHMVKSIFEGRNIIKNNDITNLEEPIAYFLTWMVNKVHECLDKYLKTYNARIKIKQKNQNSIRK